MSNNQEIKTETDKKKKKKHTPISFRRLSSKGANYTFVRCSASDCRKEKLGEMDTFFPNTHEELVFVKLRGLCLILHSKSETGKCGHDLAFRSTRHLAKEWYGPFFKKQRGRIIDPYFYWRGPYLQPG